MPYSVISLLTDFGTDDPFVGMMKGVILGIAPEVRIVDLTHSVPAQDIRIGALLLRAAVEHFPASTIHLAVVDPGVGSSRRAVVIETPRGLLVGPDNGLLAPAARQLGRRRVRSLENPAWFHHPVSRTFHGRDIFAPVAAHLARGVALEDIGPAADGLTELDLPEPRCSATAIDGEVLYSDHFGNLVTNIPAAIIDGFHGKNLFVSITGMQMDGIANSYSEVQSGAVLAIVGSAGLLEIAVRGGNAARQLAAGAGTAVTVNVVRR